MNGKLICSQKKRKVVGLDTDVDDGFFIWDKEYLALACGIDKALPNTQNRLLTLSESDRQYLVLAQSDAEPGAYLIGDRDKNTLNPIAYRYNTLTPEVLAKKTKSLTRHVMTWT